MTKFVKQKKDMKYYIIAGEASGDLHGSNLMKGIYAEDSSAVVRYWGGVMMDGVYSQDAAGGGKVRDYKDGAVMGITDVLASAGKLVEKISFCKKDILAFRPDVVILIDYPGFNIRIAEFAHKAGFKVFYYIAPKVWASREGRIRKIRKYVDRLFIIFPFEIPYFEKKGMKFTYRGNPLIDAVDDSPALAVPREGFFASHGLRQARFFAVLPGSRKGEISRTMPVAMEFADRLHSMPEYAQWQFIVAGAPSRSEEDYDRYIDGRDYVKLVFADTYGILHNAEAALINSGTASLEAALIEVPQLVVWSTSAVTAFVARKIFHVLDHVKFISLGNLIVDRLVFRELIQEDFTADEVTSELRRLVEDTAYREAMISGYRDIRSALGGKGASAAVARAMIAELTTAS